jgi:8-oxo-dGTP pyrophosphatase MutT (NUDIX family)
VLFYSQSTDRFLFLMRNNWRKTRYWGLPGGKCELNESLLDTLQRECIEEIDFWPENPKPIPLERFYNSANGFTYHTFIIVIDEEFMPKLNHEHTAYAWASLKTVPKPLHPGLWNTISVREVRKKIQQVQMSA